MSIIIEIIKAVIFGVVEGVTEWLPVSSTGHMIILQDIMPLNVSEGFWKMFEVVIQLGAIMAVVLLFFNKLWPIKEVKGKKYLKMSTMKLWVKIVIACLPAAVVGIALDDFIDEHFYNPSMVAAALIVVGAIFILIEGRFAYVKQTTVTKLSEITYKEAAIIGVFQLLAAIFPGTSRSGASLLKTVKYLVAGGVAFTGLEVAVLIIGTLTAFVVSIFVIGGLMNYIRKKDFKPFGWYRIALGVVVIIYQALR